MIELTREHQTLIRGVICKTAGNRLPSDVIDDLASETNLALLEDGSRSLKSYDADRGMSLTTFIGMVAKSVALDHFRQRTRRNAKTSSLDETLRDDMTALHADAREALVDHSEDALSMLIRRQQREHLQEAIESLNKEDQAFLKATMSGDAGANAKLAKQMGVKEVAIRVRKTRLAERLRGAIKSQG